MKELSMVAHSARNKLNKIINVIFLRFWLPWSDAQYKKSKFTIIVRRVIVRLI